MLKATIGTRFSVHIRFMFDNFFNVFIETSRIVMASIRFIFILSLNTFKFVLKCVKFREVFQE
jgi:hypothetical protein